MTWPRVRQFEDRDEAGRLLAERLKDRAFQDPLVLAIPRGGVPVGAVLARELNAELDVALSRKLRAPYQPEYAIGAVAEDGWVTLQPKVWDVPGVTKEYVAAERDEQLRTIGRRRAAVRTVRPPAAVRGRSVLVTDDGIATGATMTAALQAVRAQEPAELIVAVPVAAPDRLAEVRRWCDETVCLLTPDDFRAVGQYYRNFLPVEDEDVIHLLNATPRRVSNPPHAGRT